MVVVDVIDGTAGADVRGQSAAQTGRHCTDQPNSHRKSAGVGAERPGCATVANYPPPPPNRRPSHNTYDANGKPKQLSKLTL